MAFFWHPSSDVHAYTAALQARASEFPPESRVPRVEPADAVAVLQRLSHLLGPEAVRLAAVRRVLQEPWDPQLGVNVVALLGALLARVEGAPESRPVLLAILHEIGGTCVQGASHRLLSLYFALPPVAPKLREE